MRVYIYIYIQGGFGPDITGSPLLSEWLERFLRRESIDLLSPSRVEICRVNENGVVFNRPPCIPLLLFVPWRDFPGSKGAGGHRKRRPRYETSAGSLSPHPRGNNKLHRAAKRQRLRSARLDPRRREYRDRWGVDGEGRVRNARWYRGTGRVGENDDMLDDIC